MAWTAMAMGAFLVTLGVTLGLTVPGYMRLLRLIETDHPDVFERLGRPSMMNRSPRKSWLLQRFLYRGYKSAGVSEELARLCRHLGFWTPALVGALFLEAAWFGAGVYFSLLA